MNLDAFFDTLPHLFGMGILIVLSGLTSASETALFTLTRRQLAHFRKSDLHVAHVVLRLRDNPSTLLSTVLLANIAINILLYSMLAVTAARLAEDSAFWTAVWGVTGFVIVLFGAEIAPKLIAYAVSERLALLVAIPIRTVQTITFPVRWILGTIIVEPVTRMLGGVEEVDGTVDAEELQQLVRISQSEGLIEERENRLLHQVLELKDLRVSALMVPRVDVIAFNLAHDKQRLTKLIRSSRLLRIPVYDDNIDNIQGVILARQFLLNPDRPLRDLIRPIRFIPEQANGESLLQHFRTTQSKVALVADEYGGLAGIVALEDVVEVIVGELHAPDELPRIPSLYRINDTTYLVDAGLDVGEFRRAFNLSIEETRINTVGGLIAQMLDRLPKRGDRVSIGPARLIVLAMRDRRVLRVRLTLDRPVEDNPDLAILLATPRQGRDPSSNDRGEAGG